MFSWTFRPSDPSAETAPYRSALIAPLLPDIFTTETDPHSGAGAGTAGFEECAFPAYLRP